MLSRLIPVCHAAVVALCALPAAGQTCEPHWSDDFWASAPPGEVRALCVHDDGSGQVLYMGTAGSNSNAIAVWDRTRLKLLGSVTGSLTTHNSTGVYALAMFDDGSGPALHIAGNFTAVEGVAASCAARLTAMGWEPLGVGLDSLVRALAVFDDGSGPALYAGGLFQNAGGAPASSIARWDGQGWSPLGTGITGGAVASIFSVFPIVYSLCVFDDGSGPALYAGGNFDHAGGSPAMTVARWTGSGWQPVGNGLAWLAGEQGAVLAMAAFDGAAGPSLYAAGRVNFGPQNNNPLVVRWDGIAWHPVATWIPSFYMTSLGVADFWGAPTLHVGTTGTTLFRLDGEEWIPIGTTAGGPVRVLTGFNDGGGNHLFAGGGFGSITPSTTGAARIARWDSKRWARLPPGGASQPVTRFKELDPGTGPELYALGAYEIGTYQGGPIARFDGRGWQAVGPGGVGTPYDAEVYDDGTGPAIYIGVGGVYRLSGSAWQLVGGPAHGFTVNGVQALKTFDDGSGPRLFAGGSFPGGVRAFDGIHWTLVGNGFSSSYSSGTGPQDFEVFNAGSGPLLYVALDTDLRCWDGAVWHLVPGSFTDNIDDLVVHDDGAGPALYAGRASDTNPIIRFDGTTWTTVAAQTDTWGLALASADDGTGRALYATGSFEQLDGVAVNGVARWRDGTWQPIGIGIEGGGRSIVGFDQPDPSIWIGGDVVTAGGLSSSGLARWIGCTPCYPDCSADGLLTAADFGCFQTRFVAADPYADCDGNSVLSVGDFGCFQTRFVAGCP